MIIFTIIGIITVALIVILILIVLAEAIIYAMIITWMQSVSEFNENVNFCNKIVWMIQEMWSSFKYRLFDGSSVSSVECNGIIYEPPFRIIRKIK